MYNDVKRAVAPLALHLPGCRNGGRQRPKLSNCAQPVTCAKVCAVSLSLCAQTVMQCQCYHTQRWHGMHQHVKRTALLEKESLLGADSWQRKLAITCTICAAGTRGEKDCMIG